jgi:hypothetical protein
MMLVWTLEFGLNIHKFTNGIEFIGNLGFLGSRHKGGQHRCWYSFCNLVFWSNTARCNLSLMCHFFANWTFDWCKDYKSLYTCWMYWCSWYSWHLCSDSNSSNFVHSIVVKGFFPHALEVASAHKLMINLKTWLCKTSIYWTCTSFKIWISTMCVISSFQTNANVNSSMGSWDGNMIISIVASNVNICHDNVNNICFFALIVGTWSTLYKVGPIGPFARLALKPSPLLIVLGIGCTICWGNSTLWVLIAYYIKPT